MHTRTDLLRAAVSGVFERATDRVLSTWALGLIEVYGRFLSPVKGFRCAHAALHGGASCSHAVRGVIAQHGVLGGTALIAERFAACREAYAILRSGTASVTGGGRVQGMCCCGGIPIPFRCG